MQLTIARTKGKRVKENSSCPNSIVAIKPPPAAPNIPRSIAPTMPPAACSSSALCAIIPAMTPNINQRTTFMSAVYAEEINAD